MALKTVRHMFAARVNQLAVGLALVLLAGCSSSAGHHWGYSGETGPEHWGDLDEQNSVCMVGQAQSPIDIRGATTNAELSAIQLDYGNSPALLNNNGHTIQLDYAPGSSLTVGGDEFALLQLHFHTPSEHTVEGKAFPMEMHLVHSSTSAELAVVGVLFEEGDANAFLAGFWDKLPTQNGKTDAEVTVNASDCLPENRTYYGYSGSLTTPPCSEEVRWHVLCTPVQASAAQIAAFKSIIGANARPTQPLNGRIVARSE